MLCYGPLVSELGGAECMVPPNSVIWGACVIHQEGYNSFAPSALLDHTG